MFLEYPGGLPLLGAEIVAGVAGPFGHVAVMAKLWRGRSEEVVVIA